MPETITAFAVSGVTLLTMLFFFVFSRKYPALRRSFKILGFILLVLLIKDIISFFHLKVSSQAANGLNFLLIFLLITFCLWLLRDSTTLVLSRRGIKFSRLLWDLLTVIVYTVLILVLLKEVFKIDITPLLATSALLTVVIGLAVQDTLGNLVAGMVFHFEDSIRLGEWIEIEGKIGDVRDLSWRAIRLVTTSREMMVIPNQDFTKRKFTNLSREGAARNLLVSASYGDDPNLVMEVLHRAVLSVPGVRWDPRPTIYLQQFADYALVYRLKFYITEYRDYHTLESEVNRAIWYAFKRHGISIPFPTRTLHMQQDAPPVSGDDRQKIVTCLKQLSMFRFFNDDELAAIAAHSAILDFPAQAVIALEGQEGHSMFVILKGTVDILKSQKKVASLGKDEIFGEIALFTGEKRGATVVATASLQLLVIQKDGFESILRENKDFISKIETMINERLGPGLGNGEDADKAESKMNVLQRIRNFLLG